MKRSILLLSFLIGILGSTSAQVTAVKYLIEYNENAANYDVKLFIEEGSATTVVQRIQFNSQISVVVPTGSTMSIGEFFNPIQDNADYTGTVALEWIMGAGTIAPPIQPDEDFYAFFPNLLTVSHYNDLFAGDTLTLFTLNIDVDPCENSVRLFDNGEDPSPAEMPNGEDFSNFFTLGSIEPIYNGNLFTWYSGGWNVTLDDHLTCSGGCVELVPNLICSTDDLDYLWSTGETTPTIIVCPEETTTYTVEITNPNFEVLNLESIVTIIDAPESPIVGSNSPICAGEDIQLTASFIADATYSWMGPNGFMSTEMNPTIVSAPAEASGFYACFVEKDGCTSQAAIAVVEVFALPDAMVAGSDSLCSFETSSLTPTMGGIWESSDPGVASVTNSGFVTAVSLGEAVFTFTDNTTGCISLPSETIWVFDDPQVEIIGDDRLCIGQTSMAAPGFGGAWVSNDSTIAAIDSESGLITAVGQGTTNFTYVDSNSGCMGMTTFIIVDPLPFVNADADNICVLETTNLSPIEGGTWQTLNPEIASLNNGVISGVAPGEAGFVYTSDATGCTSDTVVITVNELPVAILSGPNVICVGKNTTVEPNTGGTWSSSDISVITVDNFGNVTGVGEGNGTLTFTSSTTLCVSQPSDTVFVLPNPEVVMSVDSICIGETFNLLPSNGGIWTSSDESVATVDSLTGEVISLSAGSVVFTFTSSETGCSSTTAELVVSPPPFEAIGSIEACVGMIGFLNIPILVGVWTTSDESVVSIDSTNTFYTADSAGTAILTFTDSSTGCSSTIGITVYTTPEVDLITEDEICVGSGFTLPPSTEGFWISFDPTIATVDNLGNVMGISAGITSVVLIGSDTGCGSEPQTITVFDNPEVTITGPDVLCIGSMSTLSPAMGGQWASSDTSVATVDSSGIVTGIGEGMASFTFSDGLCASTTENIEVLNDLTLEIDTMICEGMEYNGLTESGIYTIDTVDAVTGCDLTITIDLVVLPLSDPLCAVGLEELDANKVRLYPNPARNFVFVESETPIESISIFSTDYQKIEDIILATDTKQTQISTEKLSSGLYFVSIKADGKLTYKKLMIK